MTTEQVRALATADRTNVRSDRGPHVHSWGNLALTRPLATSALREKANLQVSRPDASAQRGCDNSDNVSLAVGAAVILILTALVKSAYFEVFNR
jgi:hypothetical protein